MFSNCVCYLLDGQGMLHSWDRLEMKINFGWKPEEKRPHGEPRPRC